MPTKLPRANPYDASPLTRGRRAIVSASALHDVVLATVEGLVGPFDDAKSLVGVGTAPDGAMTPEVVRLVLDDQLGRLVNRDLRRRVVDDARVYGHLCTAVRSFRRAHRGEREVRRAAGRSVDPVAAAKRGLAKSSTRGTTAWMEELHAAARLILEVPWEPKAFEGELAKYLRSTSWVPALRP